MYRLKNSLPFFILSSTNKCWGKKKEKRRFFLKAKTSNIDFDRRRYYFSCCCYCCYCFSLLSSLFFSSLNIFFRCFYGTTATTTSLFHFHFNSYRVVKCSTIDSILTCQIIFIRWVKSTTFHRFQHRSSFKSKRKFFFHWKRNSNFSKIYRWSIEKRLEWFSTFGNTRSIHEIQSSSGVTKFRSKSFLTHCFSFD